MENISNIIGQDLFTESSTPITTLGALAFDTYGNRFRYVKNGGATLVAAELLQEPVEGANFISMATPAITAIGDTAVQVTLGGTAVTANMFDGGRLTVSTSTGIGQSFYIKSHTIQTSTSGVCTFIVDRPFKVATVVATSKISVRKNPYNGVIEYPVTTQTGGAVGFALYAMTASYYGWIQSGGDTPVLFDNGTNTANAASGIVPSAAVAGSVKASAETDAAQIILGYSRQVASVDSTVSIAHIIID